MRKIAAILFLFIFSSDFAIAETTTLRIGDQKGGIRAVLEAANGLQNLPYRIQWFEFVAAAPLGEALNAEAIDAGVIGDAPLLFVTAAGAKVKAIAVSKSDPYGTALLVSANSPLQTIRDIKGKSIATSRGSIGHFVALKALASVGLKAEDVTFRYMLPADAKLALNQGAVDIWATWDPYTAFAETQEHLRILVNGRGLSFGNGFIAATDSALADAKKQQALQDFLNRLRRSKQWANEHPDSYSQTLAKLTGLPQEAVKLSFIRSKTIWQTIDQETIAQQQDTANFYHQSGLLPMTLQVADTFDRRFILNENSSIAEHPAKN